MYSEIPSARISGKRTGFRCPISGKVFLTLSGSKADIEECRQRQFEWTRNIMAEQDDIEHGGQPRHDMSLANRKALFLSHFQD